MSALVSYETLQSLSDVFRQYEYGYCIIETFMVARKSKSAGIGDATCFMRHKRKEKENVIAGVNGEIER